MWGQIVPRGREWGLLACSAAVSLLVWWLMSGGPLRETRLATLDRGLTEQVMAIGADRRGGAAPPLYLVSFGQKAWLDASMPGETPSRVIVDMIRFAQRSGAILALLDIDLGARRSARETGKIEPEIESAIRAWNDDPAAPVLLLTNAAGSARERANILTTMLTGLPRVAQVATVLELDEDNVVRSGAGWDCGEGAGTAAPSPLLYYAALRNGVPIRDLKSKVEGAVRHACEEGAGNISFGDAHIRASEPILFHLTGKSHALSDSGRPGFDSIEVDGVREALAREPGVPCGRSLAWFSNSCGAILVIGARHAGTSDRFSTPLDVSEVRSEGTPFETRSVNEMDGPLVLGNWLRGYSLFGPARPMGWGGAVATVLVGVGVVFFFFKLWLVPGPRIRRLRRKRSRSKRLLSRADWVFGPVVAKIFATAIWSFLLFLFFHANLAWATGAGVLAASYSAAIVFAIYEVDREIKKGKTA